MSVSKVTVGSTLSIQATKPTETVPPVGALPTRSSRGSDVPVMPVQDDKLFVRDSIGCATAEKRLDLDVPDSGLVLTECKNSSSMNAGLSIDRPVALAAVDVFSRFADDETIKKSIDQNLQLAEFEGELLKADYDFLMSSLKSKNTQLMQDLQDSLSSDGVALEEKLKILGEIAARGERASRRLDFVRSENGFSQKIQRVSDASLYRFEESQPSAHASEIIGSTSTATIKKLQDAINDVTITRADNDLYLRLKTDGTALSDVITTSNRYPGQSYDLLSPIQRFFVCCKMISKIMATTFSLAKFGSLQAVKMPSSLSTSNEVFVFESNNSNTNGDSLVENNNFDSIISPAVQGNDQLVTELNTLRESYSKSKEAFKFRRAAGFEQESCSPQDIALMAFKIVADSFPTYVSSLDGSSAPSAIEMTDALLMTFGIRRRLSHNGVSQDNISGLFRAIMLASIIDPKYKFGDSEPEIFDSVSESKIASANSDGETSTTRSTVGTNSKGSGTVGNEISNSSLYSSITKRVEVAPISREWAADYLSRVDALRQENPSVADEIYRFADVFYYERLRDSVLRGATPGGGSQSAVIATVESDFGKPVLTDSIELQDNLPIMKGVYDSLRNFGDLDTGTCRTSVMKLYSNTITKFKSAYRIEEFDDTQFHYDSVTEFSKNVILDLLFECLSNCIMGTANLTLYENRGRQPIEYGIISLHVSKCEIIAVPYDSGIAQRYTLAFPESIRLLKHISDLTSARGRFIDFVATTLSRGLQRFDEIIRAPDAFGSRGSDFFYNTVRDLSDSDFLAVASEINSAFLAELTSYGNLSSKFNSLQTITEIVEESVSDIIGLSAEARAVRDALSDFSSNQKADVFKCLSLPSVSSVTLKNRNRRITVSESFESSYERERMGLDVSAARWFFKNRTFADYEKSRLVFFGLPQGFTNAFTRQAKSVDPETFEIVDTNAPPNSSPVYFEAWMTARPVQESENVYKSQLMNFHPLIHVVQKSKILENDSLIEILTESGSAEESSRRTSRFETGSARSRTRERTSQTSDRNDLKDRFSIYVLNISTGRWGPPIEVDSADFKNSVSKLGLTVKSAAQIVNSHILDSIHKSVVRTISGLEIDADTLGTYRKGMSARDAGAVLQLMADDTAGIIPRGSMSAIDFLSLSEAGFIESVPFSRLRGSSSDKSNPSEHALLMKFLDTRAFTKGTLSREVLLPSTFERIYCGLFDANDLIDPNTGIGLGLDQTFAKILNISQITIKAIRS